MAGTIIADRIQADTGTGSVQILSNTGTTVATFGGDGQLRFVAGFASVPAIAPAGDLNTGIFFPAADTVAIGTGGTEALRVNSSQNVGIGTQSPAVKLDVAGNATIQNGVLTVGKDTIYDAFINTPESMYFNVDSDGNSTNNKFVWGTDRASNTGGTTWMTLDASGRLLVGTTTAPNSTDIKTFINSSGGGFVGFAANGTAGGAIGCPTTSILVFYTAAGTLGSETYSERARITSSGSLIVGGTSVSFAGAMSEFQQSSGDCVVSINRTGTLSNGQQASIYAVGGSRQASTFVYKHSGITNPCGALNVQCEDAEQNYLWADNSDVLRISTNAANIGTTGGTVVGTQTSDERLKNISGAISYGLTEVMALQPIAFAMKDDPQTAKVGFSAQQVQRIIPESVYDTGECIDGYDVDPDNKLITTPKSDRTKLAMEYTQLIPVLVKAIQELNAKVEAQAAEIAALKGNA